MRLSRSSVALLAGVVLAASIFACGDRKAGPAGPGPVTPFVQSVVMLGPGTVEPGASAQYTVELRMSDGSTQSPTDVMWASSVPAVLEIDARGLATAGSSWSETNLTAAVRLPNVAGSSRAVTREILVQPAGTFRLVGVVTDAEVHGLGIPQARLEVRASPDLAAPIATYATTTGTGSYRLYGVPRDGYLHIRKEGYAPTTQPVQLETHARRDFLLRLGEARLSLDGAYTMTVEATRCASQALPPELRHRRYGAVISQSDGRLRVKLTDAAFHADGGLGDGFAGIAGPSGALVQITGFFDFYYYPDYPGHPDLAEILSDGTVLVVNGRGMLSGTRERLSGTISGSVIQYEAPTFPGVRYLTGCHGGTVVTLTRR